MVYNLTCIVSKTVTGLVNSPITTWSTGGGAISTGNGITVSTMTTSEFTINFQHRPSIHREHLIVDSIGVMEV